MAKGFGEKLKILYIRDYLLRNSDEEHPVSVKEIISDLRDREIEAERKSVYRDLRTLGYVPEKDEFDEDLPESYGMDIARKKDGFYVRERDFTLQEVKLLVDMVQSSNSITLKKTQALINKLESLVSVHEAKTLNRTVFVRNRVKTMNESVYINVDKISEAINSNRPITFQYYRYNMRKEKEQRHSGENYLVSPFALIWVDQNYYLLGYNHAYSGMRTYRVDRMGGVKTASGQRLGREEFEKIDIATYTTKVFHMYTGELCRVTMRFDKSLADAVIDRFGEDVILIPGTDSFTVNTEVAVSPQFYGWVAGFGRQAEIVSPPSVRKGMAEHLRGAASLYD